MIKSNHIANAVRFRCHLDEADGLRLDIMATLRGVAPFETLWRRRTILTGRGRPGSIVGDATPSWRRQLPGGYRA